MKIKNAVNKRLLYDIFFKVGGTIVLCLVITGSVMIKTDTVKPMITASAGIYAPQKIVIDAGHGALKNTIFFEFTALES